MQEPFRSVPLIWIVHEDILANQLPVYQKMGQNSLISHWRSAFARANVVVFPQFTLPVDSISLCYHFQYTKVSALYFA